VYIFSFESFLDFIQIHYFLLSKPNFKKRLFSLFVLFFVVASVFAQSPTIISATGVGESPGTTAQITGAELEGLNYSNSTGLYSWVVPQSGLYRIKGVGASGGGYDGRTYNYSDTYRPGFGAIIQGDFYLVQGDTYNILIGQKGEEMTGSSYAAGGGGGTFMVKSNNSPLVIAGGGAGGGSGGGDAMKYLSGGKDGSTSTSGNTALAYNNYAGESGAGGQNGQEGSYGKNSYNQDWHAFPGAGFYTDANATSDYGTPAKSFLNGGTGGISSSYSDGGFGGGGHAKKYGGAGGGGYSGGGGQGRHSPGGGGGSFIDASATNINTSNGLYDGTAVSNLSSYNFGNGYLEITVLQS